MVIRTLIALWLPLSLFVSFARSQQSAQKDDMSPSFKSKTELVIVPVLVRDKDGKSVGGLKQEDFTLLENGVERRIAFFEDVQTTTTRMELPTTESGVLTNVFEGRIGSQRVTVLVLDLLNTRIMDQNYARQQLLKYLSESLEATEPTAFFVLTRDGLRLIQDFTSDPKLLIAAINRMRQSNQKVAEDAADVQRDLDTFDRMKTGKPEWDHILIQMQQAFQDSASQRQESSIVKTLESMQQLARYLKGIPGRKAVVWATGGFPFEVAKQGEFPFEMDMVGSGALADKVRTTTRPTRSSYGDVQSLYVGTWNALTAAGVALYPVDVQGLMPTASIRADTVGWVGSHAIRNQQNSSIDWDQKQSMDTMRVFAEATGGKAFLNNNDLTKGFREAAQDSANYYLLSYYLEREAKPGWHKLSVKVKPEGLQVRARTGFYVVKPEDEKAVAELDTYAALQSPINSTELPLAFRWSEQAPGKDKGKNKVGYEVELPANVVLVDESNKNRMAVQFLALVRDADGKEVGHPVAKTMDVFLNAETLAQVRDSGLTYKGAIELAPGEYRVRFVVRDMLSGKIGSVSAPIKVEKN